MSYQVDGTLIHIGAVEEINERFKKRVIVLRIQSGDEGQYVEEVPFELVNRATHYVDNMAPGTPVTLMFSLRGRRGSNNYSERWFGSLNCYNIRAAEGSEPPPFPAQGAPPAQQPQASTAPAQAQAGGQVDEIPF